MVGEKERSGGGGKGGGICGEALEGDIAEESF